MPDRTLILVDLDNLYTGASGWKVKRLVTAGLGTTADDEMKPMADLSVQVLASTVVVVALNQTTATARVGVDAGYLRRFARSLASGLGCEGTAVCELALVLTAPQTADCALLRLFDEAPHQYHGGEFARVVLASRDRGLRVRLGLTRPLLTVPDCWLWQDRRRQTRTHTQSAPGAPPPETPNGWSAAVRTPQHVASVTAERIECDSGSTDLAALAAECDATPHLLTQFGLTWSVTPHCDGAVRGVDRLRRRLTYRPDVPVPLSPLSAGDGVEFCNARRLPRTAGGPIEEATVGAGAIRVPGLEATLRCDLSASTAGALVALAPTHALSAGARVVTAALLASAMPAGSRFVALGVAASVSARATPDRSVVVCEVEFATGEQPRVWWNTDGRSRSEARVMLPATQAFNETGLAVEVALFDHSIVLAAPAFDRVRVALALDAGQLGVGTGGAPPTRCMVIPLDDSVDPGDDAACIRVQELDGLQRTSLASQGWSVDELLHLPVLIITHAVA